MNCTNCGAPMQPGEKFCNNCGAAAPVAQPMVQPMNQPMNQPQPMYQQPMMQQPQQKGSSPVLLVVMIGIIAVLLVALVYFAIGNDNNNETSNTNEKKEEIAVATTTVNFGGYTFKVPTEYSYEFKSNKLQISDDQTWAGQIELASAQYNTVKANRTNIATNFKRYGYASSDASIKTVNGVEFITVEITFSGRTNVVGYAKASDNQVFVVQVLNQNRNADYSALEKMAGIIKSAKYNGGTNSISTDTPDGVGLLGIGITK